MIEPDARRQATHYCKERHQVLTREDVLQRMIPHAVEVLGVREGQVVEGARFKEDLSADSLDLVEFVMALEEGESKGGFAIKIEEEELSGITTVGQAIDLVLSKLYPPDETGSATAATEPADQDNRETADTEAEPATSS